MPSRRLSTFRALLPRLPLRYLIADRHQVLCSGVETLLSECADLECVAHVNDGKDLMGRLCQHKPDILLVDIVLDGVSPLAVFRQCRQCMPEMGIIVHTVARHPLAIRESACAGAHAYISKSEGYEQLLDVIFCVATGQHGLFPGQRQKREQILSDREREVFHGIASGMSINEISRKMHLGFKTVEMYRSQLLRRFGVRKSTDLVRIALESGIVLNSRAVVFPLCPKALNCERHLRALAKG